MTTRILRGDQVAARVYDECARGLERLRARGVVPGLAVVVVGRDPASLAYVGSKRRTCERLGIRSVIHELVEGTSQTELLDLVRRLNADDSVHGILVQSPPPSHIDEAAVVREIDPRKDVDGFHPANVAMLAMGEAGGFVPCTPLGVQRLLVESGVRVEGARVVIVGRSLIVGKSLALLLMGRGTGADATVTVAHSRTADLAAVTRDAEILVAAVGRPGCIGAAHVREGAVVVDVGINRVPDPGSPRGTRLVGDVDFDAVAPRCAAITPVPGGVGPMTIAMLMSNTVRAAEMATARAGR